MLNKKLNIIWKYIEYYSVMKKTTQILVHLLDSLRWIIRIFNKYKITNPYQNYREMLKNILMYVLYLIPRILGVTNAIVNISIKYYLYNIIFF